MKKESKERVVLKQTLEMLMEAVYSKNPAKITKAYAKYYKNIQQELDRAREEGRGEALEILQRVRPYLIEPVSTTLEYRTPAQALRYQADQLDKREGVIKEFEEFISKLTTK